MTGNDTRLFYPVHPVLTDERRCCVCVCACVVAPWFPPRLAQVVKIVRKELSRHGDTQRVCETLTRKAIDERYTQDNVSIVLVVLKKFW